MNYLLDTHIILWWLDEPKKIAHKARQLIADRENQVFVSSVSFWEMAIKSALGRLNLPRNMLRLLLAEGFQTLPLLPEETLSIIDLPALHNDSFDRMLVAQAIYNNLVLITKDEQIVQYPATVIKA